MCLKTLFSCFLSSHKSKPSYNDRLNASADHNIPIPNRLTNPARVKAYYTDARLAQLPHGELALIQHNATMPSSVRSRAKAVYIRQQGQAFTGHTQPWLLEQQQRQYHGGAAAADGRRDGPRSGSGNGSSNAVRHSSRALSSVPSQDLSALVRTNSPVRVGGPATGALGTRTTRPTMSEPVDEPVELAYRAYRKQHDAWYNYSAA